MAVLLRAVVSVKSPKSVSTVEIRLLHSGCRSVSVHRFKLHLHLLSIRFILLNSFVSVCRTIFRRVYNVQKDIFWFKREKIKHLQCFLISLLFSSVL